jgi:hypothetical protein
VCIGIRHVEKETLASHMFQCSSVREQLLPRSGDFSGQVHTSSLYYFITIGDVLRFPEIKAYFATSNTLYISIRLNYRDTILFQCNKSIGVDLGARIGCGFRAKHRIGVVTSTRL